MNKLAGWGYGMVVAALVTGALAYVFYKGDTGEALYRQLLLICVCGTIAILLRGWVMAAWGSMAKRSGIGKRCERDPAARLGKRAGGAEDPAESMKAKLASAMGERGRKALPRLLLTGDAETVGRMFPELPRDGWVMTPDAVLLWATTGTDSLPERIWLRHIYKLRRTRPVDAIVLVTDGETPLVSDNGTVHPFESHLLRIRDTLRWSAPIYVLESTPATAASTRALPLIAVEMPNKAEATEIEASLLSLRNNLAACSLTMPQPVLSPDKLQLARISVRLDTRAGILARWLGKLMQCELPVRGVVFAPYPEGDAEGEPTTGINTLPCWQYIGDAARRCGGIRGGKHPYTIGAKLALVIMGCWTLGMLVSGVTNVRDVSRAAQAASNAREASDAATRLRSLLALQHEVERYDDRRQRHPPLSTRFGLNRDKEILAALRKPYADASRELLVEPVRTSLEASLDGLAKLPAKALDEPENRWAKGGHDALKAYLMLTEPARIDADFLTQQLIEHWTTDARITPGAKLDLGERLLGFYVQQLASRGERQFAPRDDLVRGARQTLLAVIGQRNAQDTVYRAILDDADGKYPDKTLASMTAGTDARGLLRSRAVVPGIYTREAFEGYVAEAIEKAAKRSDVASDWVLGDMAGDMGGDGALNDAADARARQSADAMREALIAQYFAGYAEHWQAFMNGLQWAPATTLPASIEQLKLLGDTRQSPVIALMKSLAWQGGAGQQKGSLAEALVGKARTIFGKKADRRAPTGPLDATFGPILRLAGHASGPEQAGESARESASDVSLQRFLDRSTALRIRLQQVAHSADGGSQARLMAQALFQGRGSELADTQAYAQLVAASLGAEWAGMGDALFVQPIVQATQAILHPAQASLNDAWRQNVAAPWGRAFVGRYPFADTPNDASLAELSRFVRPGNGLIHAFLGNELAGVLALHGDRWGPAATGGQGLVFDPAFLKAINDLQRISDHMLAEGVPQYRFEMMPIPTPGLTDTMLIIDGQQLHYFNQREEWQALRWPADNLQTPGTRLQWQAETAGTNKSQEFRGRWGWVRMLEHASVVPLDSANFQLTWQGVPDASRRDDADTESLTPRAAMAPTPGPTQVGGPIRYLLRTEAGQGPLELLTLRGFVLPTRVFATQ